MKRTLLLLSSLLVLSGVSPIFAEENPNEDRIEEIKAQIKELQAELKELQGDSAFEITLNNPMKFGDYEITFTGYDLGTDYEGKDALIVDYHWVNNSDESTMPFMSFSLKGFQNNVETDSPFMVDGVDLGVGQKEVRSGGEIEAQTVVGITDMNMPLELELSELLSFNKTEVYTIELDLNNLPE